METIKEMIQRMCPEGVSMVKLCDCCQIQRGKRVVRKDLALNGTIPVFQNSLTPLGFSEQSNYPNNTPFVISAGAAGEVGYSNVPMWAADDCLAISSLGICDNRYIYFFLKTKEDYLKTQIRGGAIKRLSKDIVEYLEIPLPPLPIQQEIVRILDSFTQLQSNLEAELAARQKQYEYYRKDLLSIEIDQTEIEIKSLSELSIISRGKRVVRKDLMETGEIPVYQNSLKPLGFSMNSNYPANTPFVISAGAAGEVGFSSVNYWGADDCFSIICGSSLDSKYAYYWLKTKEDYLKSRIRGGAIKRLSRDEVENLQIVIPSLDRQKEIVTTLDTFESLISNLKQEIELRKKQYEYYREQLLTFE